MATFSSFGTLFKQGTNTIAQVRSISGPGMSKDVIDTTHLTSTNGWRTFLASFKDAGEVEVGLLWDPTDTSHEILEDNFASTATAAYSIVFSDPASTTFQFNAFVTAQGPQAPLGEALTNDYTLKITGTPTTD